VLDVGAVAVELVAEELVVGVEVALVVVGVEVEVVVVVVVELEVVDDDEVVLCVH
jgi:hypothetical protein